MTDRAPDMSVVICAYTEDRWEELNAAVASVQRQTTPPREIIVVIDHNPALLARAQAHLHGVAVVENGEQQGLSGARNTGVLATSGSLIAFLDDDATAAPDWLSWLGRACADARVLGCGGLVEPAWQGRPPSWLPPEFYWVVGCSYRGLPQTRTAVRNPIGASMCLRREVFAAVGGFSAQVGRLGQRPAGCEETELCIRARQHWPERLFLYEPAARVRHAVPASRATWAYFRARCYHEGRSKALVAQAVGTGIGLEAERAYMTRTLPRGMLRGVADAVLRGDRGGLARAAAMVAGVALTTAGYATARWGQLVANRHMASAAWRAALRRSGRRGALGQARGGLDGKVAPQDAD